MPCGKLKNPFVLNEFRAFFHGQFALPLCAVHILSLPLKHALRPSCAFDRIGDVQHPGLSRLCKESYNDPAEVYAVASGWV